MCQRGLVVPLARVIVELLTGGIHIELTFEVVPGVHVTFQDVIQDGIADDMQVLGISGNPSSCVEVGDVVGHCGNGDFTLEDVYRCPDVTRNIISVSKLTFSGASVLFAGDGVTYSRRGACNGATGVRHPAGHHDLEQCFCVCVCFAHE